MKFKILISVIFPVLILSFLVSCIQKTNITFSGKVFNLDGAPLDNAIIYFTKYAGPSPFEILIDSVFVEDGKFKYNLNQGKYRFEISTKTYKYTGMVPLITDGKDILAEICLTPTEKQQFNNLPIINYGKRNTLQQRIYNITREKKNCLNKIFQDKNFSCDSTIGALRYIMKNHDERIAIRQFAALTLAEFTAIPHHEVDLPDSIRNEINFLLPPSSPIWSLSRSNSLPIYIKKTNGLLESKKRLNQFLRDCSDPVITTHAIANLAFFARHEGKLDSMNHYCDLLQERQYIRSAETWLNMLRPLRIKTGERLPEFKIELINNDKITNHDLKGNYCLIHFWATWCQGCVESLIYIEKAFELYKDRNFRILSIALDQKESVLDFQKEEHKMPWLNAIDPYGFKSDNSKLFEVTYLPKCILINPEGTIIEETHNLETIYLLPTLKKYFKD